ncbi:hypothetical protein D3C72_902470 [compost metagenome]
MHAVQRHVEHPRQPAFEHHAAGEVAHQVTHSRKTRQRDQRAVVGVLVLRQCLAFDAQFQRFGQQRSLLVSGLGTWWHIAVAARLRAGGAVTEGEDVLVTGGLQGRQHLQLIDAVGFQAIDVLEETRCANPRGPDFQAGLDFVAVGGDQAVGRHFADSGIGHDVDPEFLQGFMHRPANALRQRRQHPWTGFDQGDVHVFRFDPVQAIGRQFVGGVVQLGGQFDPGGTGADDRHADLFDCVGLTGVCAQIVIEQLLVEALGLFAGVEEQAVLRCALGAEIVGGAANGDHQRVVGHFAGRHQFQTGLVVGGGQLDFFIRAIEPAHAPQLELEVVPFGLGDIVEFVFGRVQGTGRHFVQQRFPDVGQVRVDQHHAGRAALAQSLTQTGSQLQTAGAAADNDNTMGHGDNSQG